MTPAEQYLAKLEEMLRGLGIATGYDAQAEKARQEEWIAAQKGGNDEIAG